MSEIESPGLYSITQLTTFGRGDVDSSVLRQIMVDSGALSTTGNVDLGSFLWKLRPTGFEYVQQRLAAWLNWQSI